MLERLQKILSARGIASRRKAEEYLTAGLVTVNGVVAQLGQKADPATDVIAVDGKVLEDRARMLYFLMNKPRGVETKNVDSFSRSFVRSKPAMQNDEITNQRTNESTNRHPATVRDLLPQTLQGKVYPVGRLDKDSEGLLLFTNDGALANRLMHPRYDHEKVYEVTTRWDMKDDALQQMAAGMIILGQQTKESVVQRLGDRRFRIALTEGKNRQIRRMVEKAGNRVVHLRRVRIMTLEDPALQPGQVRTLTPKERRDLLRSVGLDAGEAGKRKGKTEE